MTTPKQNLIIKKMEPITESSLYTPQLMKYFNLEEFSSTFKKFVQTLCLFILAVVAAPSQNLLNPIMQVSDESGRTTYALYEVDSRVLARVLAGDSIEIDDINFVPDAVESTSLLVRTSAGDTTVLRIHTASNDRASLSLLPDGTVFFYYLDSLPRLLHKVDDFYVMGVDTSDQGFQCAALSHPEIVPTADDVSTLANKVVGVYFEADKALHDAKGGVAGTVSWIHSVFEVVKLLYSRESISTKISEIFIWNTPDPYSTTSSLTALQQFRSSRPQINGDLAHLLALKPSGLGGIAWVNTLCTNYNYAYSNIQSNFSVFPNYSWTVMVIAHEMGHNLGSLHTQSCAWGPNKNQALDNCYQTEGNCAAGPAPVGGGTVMSYCHLSQYGTNLERGFGTEPGNLIRSRVAAANCLAEENVCEYPVPTTKDISPYSATVHWNNTGIGLYYIRYKAVEATAWTEHATNQTQYPLSNLLPNTIYSIQVRPDCQRDYAGEIRLITPNVITCGDFPAKTFETDLGMLLGGDIQWLRRRGGTGSSGTGPNQAVEGFYYMYVESSSPNNPNKTAVAETECFEIRPMQALSFAYHMYGNTMGELKVVLNGTTIFSEKGNQGNIWKVAVIDLPPTSNAVLSFVGITGNGYRSDIAVDDVKVINKTVDACTARPGNSAMEWIESIKIGGTTFSTGNNNGYLEKEISPALGRQTLTITPGYLRQPCQDLFIALYSDDNGVWVEKYQYRGKSPAETVLDLSTTKYRVILSANPIPNACAEVKWGEIEDYIIR